MTVIPKNPDVVVVGAGAAGLAAARRLKKKGLVTIVVEAANRVGGRAWTDAAALGVPVDMGCSWVSGSDKNSLVKIGRKNGLTLVNHTDAPSILFVGDRRATKEEFSAYVHAEDVIDRALNKAGKKRLDVPASEVIPKDLQFSGTAQSWLGPMDYGVDFKDLSPIDHWMQDDDQPSYLVAEGFGTLVSKLAEGVPVALNTRAETIDWSGQGVTIETDRGSIRTRACLITVSTGVLAEGGLRFVPELPEAKQAAVYGVPMGLLVKVPLLFDGARLDLPEGAWVTYKVPETVPARACYFIAWPCGHNYVFGNIGGEIGREVSREGEAAAVDFALGEMVKMLGAGIRKHFLKGKMTDWATNPLTYGAYSVQRPGHRGARKALGEPVAKKIFFAGEAMGGASAALANGAYDSGRKAAKRIARQLGV